VLAAKVPVVMVVGVVAIAVVVAVVVAVVFAVAIAIAAAGVVLLHETVVLFGVVLLAAEDCSGAWDRRVASP
jgi:hypothetical protein